MIFLDIQMPEITGIEFIKNINIRPYVIFTTAYPDYAIESYELNVIDYLLKPFTFERFFQSVNKTINLINKIESNNSSITPNDTPITPIDSDYITLKSNHKLIKQKYNEIAYIEGLGEYLTYYTINGSKIIVLDSFKRLQEVLPENFIRVHKSYIVAKDKVKEMEGNTLKVIDKVIPVGKSYRKGVLEGFLGGSWDFFFILS